jgi:twitching motility protein PilT
VAVDINKLFQTMLRSGISDIHFKAGTPPMVRIHGRLMSSGFNKMGPEHIQELANLLMSENQRAIFEREHELDMSYSVPDLSRFRVNVYRQKGTVALSLRVVPLQVKSFEELNLPSETMRKLCHNTRGMLLVAGITGAGKTTTLNSMVDYINKNFAYNMIMIEDPIEYYHTNDKSSIAQREVGQDTPSFGSAVKHLLRQDPDVVVLGKCVTRNPFKLELPRRKRGIWFWAPSIPWTPPKPWVDCWSRITQPNSRERKPESPTC